jgi:hypothetical protein
MSLNRDERTWRRAIESYVRFMRTQSDDHDRRLPQGCGPYASSPVRHMLREIVDLEADHEPSCPIFCACGHTFLILSGAEGLCERCHTKHPLPQWEIVGQE